MMQHIWKSTILCLGLYVLQCSLISICEAQHTDLLDYLPDPAGLQPWEPEDEPRTAEGETLFMLINGAAEMYFEYGFQRAIFQTYIQGDDQWIDVEIYEMTDAVAAYGLQSFKRGRVGKKLEIGQDAFLEEDYLNFWKGNVQVSVVGQDDSEATLEALIQIAKALEAGIPGERGIPELVRLFAQSEFPPLQHVYIKGQLGLSNHSPLPPDMVTDFDEGLIGTYDDFTLILLKYSSKEDVMANLTRVEQEQNFYVKASPPNYLIILLGENLSQTEEFCQQIEVLLQKDAQE